MSDEKVERKQVQRRKTVKQKGFSREDRLSRIELYEKEDQNDQLNQPMRPYEGFNGPRKIREMTDRLCIFFLVILSFTQLFHGAVLYNYGEISRITCGLDFREELCGVGGLIKLPYLYYGQPTVDINVAWCVDTCPKSTGPSICLYDIDHFTPTPFCYVQLSSTRVGRTCLPNEPVNKAVVDNHISSTENYVRRIMSDLLLSWDLIFFSMILISISAYFFTYLLSIPSVVQYQVWTQVWSSILCFEVLAYLFYREYQRVIEQRCLFQIDKHNCGGNRATLFYLAFLGAAVLGGLFLLYVMKMFNKINLAISLIKTASKIVVVLKQLRFFAMFVAIIGFGQFAYSIIAILYGMTIGNQSTIPATGIDGSAVKVFVTTTLSELTTPYQAFMTLFFLLFVLSINEMFNTYALSVWFFTKKKATVAIPLRVVLGELVKHHLGSCVFAVMMEILFFIPKWTIYLIYWFLETLPQLSLIVRFAQGCCLCCLACYHNFLRYLSKHSLVQVAIWSEGYWVSSRKAYFLLKRNQDKVLDLDFLIEFILFKLKLSNSLIMSLPIYIFLTLADNTPYGNKISDIESPLIPTLFVFIMGFFYTSVFQVSYDITSKSIIQLYLVDREMFYGEQRFCEKFIEDFMEFYGKFQEDKLQNKSKKLIKYSAKVAPMQLDEKPINNIQEDDEEEEEQENDDDEDEDEEEEDDEEEGPEQTYMDQGGTSQKFKMKTQAKQLSDDPFSGFDQSQDNITIQNSHLRLSSQQGSRITNPIIQDKNGETPK